MKDKRRLDVELYERGLCESIEKARALIMAGRVYSLEKRLDKAGTKVDTDLPLTVRTSESYASRGALKFKKAIEAFSIDLTGQTAMDIGAAAGGFTDIMLKAGAAKVYAIDVGYGQMDWRLRNDPRVVVMERTNARYLKPGQFMEPPTFCGMDVSFISVLTILPAILRVMKPPLRIASLIKPQFEAPRELVGAKGVVREPTVHELVLNKVIEGAKALGISAQGLTFSPVTGPEGNIEFLIDWVVLGSENKVPDTISVSQTVMLAHEALYTRI